MPRIHRATIWLVIALTLVVAAFYSFVSVLTTFAATSPPERLSIAEPPASSARIWLEGGHDAEFAYVQYAVNRQYLCNALLNARRLRMHSTRATLAILVPDSFLQEDSISPIGRLMTALIDEHQVVVHTTPLIQRLATAQLDLTYVNSFMKLKVFDLPYRKIIYFDNDGLIMRNMDELFASPAAALALPRAWWLPRTEDGGDVLCSALMVIEPSKRQSEALAALSEASEMDDYDMEVINRFANSTAMILPHQKYLLLSSLFRGQSRESYLGTANISHFWDAKEELDTAFYIHFSDFPIPKPWQQDRSDVGKAALAKPVATCLTVGESDPDCISGRIWQGLYDEFQAEMQEFCPSPYEQWPPMKSAAG